MSKSCKKKAEKLYTQELKKIIKIVGNKTTYSDQLYKVGKQIFGPDFLGVFTSDRIPNTININKMAIINLDSSEMSGSHWVAICKDKKGIIWVYDSFGRNTHEILPDIYGKKRIIKTTERDAEQNKNESNCGARCLAFLKVFDKYGSKFAKYI